MIEPISVWELEAGKPKYQVPRFQMIAAISSAKTIAKPAPVPTCRISSTGSSDTMPNATAPRETSTPRKFQMPDQTTANSAGKRVGIDHGRDRIRGVMESVDELEAERDQQRHDQQQIGQVARELGAGGVDVGVNCRIQTPRRRRECRKT